MNGPGPFSPLNFPIRSTTAFSHWSATRMDAAINTERIIRIPNKASFTICVPHKANEIATKMTNTEAVIGLNQSFLITFVVIVLIF